MRKNILKVFPLLLVCLLFYSVAFASVGTQNSGTQLSDATTINFSTGLTASSDGSKTTVTSSGTQTITAGTIDGAVIGGSTPAAGTFTTLTFRTSLLTIGYANGGVSTMVTASTVIPVSYGQVKITGSGGATKTLANGTIGQVLQLVCVDYKTPTTITPATSTGWASVSLGADGHSLTLVYVNDTVGWWLAGYSGATITYKNSGL